MHDLVTNASIQLIPIGGQRHPYEWIDEVIGIIADSGLNFEVGPFGTSVEGTYADISGLIADLNEYLFNHHCPEWLLNVQWQIRATGDVTMKEKTEKHQKEHL